MGVSAQCQWKLHSMNPKTSFLQGHVIRDVYVNPPTEANCNGIWWLNNYSLWIKWHFSLLNSNLSWLKNDAMSQMDSTMFYYFDITHSLVAGQVCDFIWSGSKNFENISYVTIWMGHHIEEEVIILLPC